MLRSDDNLPAAPDIPSPVIGQRRRRPTKEDGCPFRKAARTSASDASLPQLNDDLLLCVFRFFVSSDGYVDGESLRSCMLACRKWRRAASCASLWKIPANISCPEENGPRTIRSIQSSLRIKEVVSQPSSNHKRMNDSLLGFINLGMIPSNDPHCLSFQALEKANNKRYNLKITRTRTLTREILQEAFIAHFLQGNDSEFCSTKGKEDCTCPNQLSPPRNLPGGIQILFGRFVLWYPDESRSESRLAFPNPPTSVLSSPWPFQNLFISCLPIGRITTGEEHWKSILKHLLNLEGHPPLDYIGMARNNTPVISGFCWAKLVDWLVEIIECFDLEDKLAFRALMYFGQFVSSSQAERIRKDRYQLYAGTALLIAAKCESDMSQDISCNDIIFSADNTFSVEDIDEAEVALLSKLDWRLAMPTILDFLELYIQLLPLRESRAAWMMRYLAELALQSPIHFLYLPSKIAACVVVIALYCLGEENNDVELWPAEIEKVTRFTWESLELCLVTLSTLLDDIRRTMPELSIISRRYQRATRASVALIRVSQIASFATLTAFRDEHRRRLVLTDIS